MVTSMAIDHRGLMTAVKLRLRAGLDSRPAHLAGRLARIAGALYLLVVVLGGIAQLVVRAGIRLPGAATATAQHIDAQPATFHISVIADIAMAVIFVVVGVTLYLLFRHIDRHVAGATVVFAAVGAGMIVVNLLFHLAALLGETGASQDAQSSHGAMTLLLDMYDHGYPIAGIFFGLCLLPLGYLAYRSGRIPPVVSTLLIVSWILDALFGLLWRDLPAVIHTIIAPPPVADLWLMLYMVAKGVFAPRRDQIAVAPGRADQAAAARPAPSCDVSQATSKSDGHAPVRR
jgi:hypothetical protein